MHIAFVVAALGLAVDSNESWKSVATSTLPTILGFSLGAYTLTFTLMGTELHTALQQAVHPKRRVSLLAMVNVTFFHAVFIQIVSYLFSVIASGTFFYKIIVVEGVYGHTWPTLFEWMKTAESFVGTFLVIYSIALMLSVTIAIYRLANIVRGSSTAATPDTSAASD